MKFSTRQDLEAPIDFVFENLTNFAEFERQAMRRGIVVERTSESQDNGCGIGWSAIFSFRGKKRNVAAEVSEFESPNLFAIQSVSDGIEADLDVEFLQLSRGRTRVKVGLQMVPKNLSSRLLIQSLKFAKANLNKRFESRVKQFATNIEDKFNKGNSFSKGY